MRIAFVGKGGSGKSTLAALFTDFVQNHEGKVLAVDADINQHLADLIGASLKDELALSKQENAELIREYVKGENPRIDEASNVVKSTPPGRGSNFVRLEEDNRILDRMSAKFSDEAWFMHVGTYEKDGIGASCYHTSLASFENILSHLDLEESEWLVADMVAGTDAFANTLHVQFDLIVLVVEPTPEGLKVYEQYRELAREASVEDHLAIVGNKIDGKADKEYLEENIEDDLLGFIPRRSEIKKARRKGDPLSTDLLGNDGERLFQRVVEESRRAEMRPDERLDKIEDIHRTVSKQQYIQDACGDVTTQIDEEFSWE